MAKRIRAEAALLEAVAADNAAEVSEAFGLTQKLAPQLLALVVKPTFNDEKDETAFYHSVASYGLDFVIGENITQLAKRNSKIEALRVLDATEKKLNLLPRPLETEAQLLVAVSQDNGEEVSKLLACPQKPMLLQLQVKESYGDATDSTAFYHSVASKGLKFELGDTLLDLARRNNSSSVVQSLTFYSQIELSITNPMTGANVCTLAADGEWTIGRVSQEVGALHPTAGGCRMFLLGEAALTSGTRLSDLATDGTLELFSVVRSNVAGVYRSTFMPLHPERGWAVLPSLDPSQMRLELLEDGKALAEYVARPLDRGATAPPSGGLVIRAEGTWNFEAPGIAVHLEKGFYGSFRRMVPRADQPWTQKQTLRLQMIAEDQLDLTENIYEDRLSLPCPVGSAFLKSDASRRD